MTQMHQTVGNTVATWVDADPLRWTMTEAKCDEPGRNPKVRTESIDFDLTSLSDGYEELFLLNLKKLLVDHRKRVRLATLGRIGFTVKKVLGIMQQEPPSAPVTVIDRVWLGRLRTVASNISAQYLDDFKIFFNSNRDSPIFSSDLVPADFPRKSSVKGSFGDRVDRILKGVLTRAAQVAVPLPEQDRRSHRLVRAAHEGVDSAKDAARQEGMKEHRDRHEGGPLQGQDLLASDQDGQEVDDGRRERQADDN